MLACQLRRLQTLKMGFGLPLQGSRRDVSSHAAVGMPDVTCSRRVRTGFDMGLDQVS